MMNEDIKRLAIVSKEVAKLDKVLALGATNEQVAEIAQKVFPEWSSEKCREFSVASNDYWRKYVKFSCP